MEKRLDVIKVREALKRAGRTAIIGSKEARSGKFLYSDRFSKGFDISAQQPKINIQQSYKN